MDTFAFLRILSFLNLNPERETTKLEERIKKRKKKGKKKNKKKRKERKKERNHS
jgi:hypothetical protein